MFRPVEAESGEIVMKPLSVECEDRAIVLIVSADTTETSAAVWRKEQFTDDDYRFLLPWARSA